MEEDRDQATSDFYPAGDREPLQGFKDENHQLHTLGASLLLQSRCGAGEDKPRERVELGRG